jgi:hypothetical protein
MVDSSTYIEDALAQTFATTEVKGSATAMKRFNSEYL